MSPRTWLVLAALAAAAVPAAAAAQRTLTIERFHAAIRVERDAGIRVTETINVRFDGSWNGLYRTIPVKYRTAQGLNWTLGLDLESATDAASGQSLRVEASRERHYVKYKIWVPGAQDVTRTLVLRYRATNGLRFFEEHDELYWNVTGDEWDVPIQAAAARVDLPEDAAGVRAVAFNGAYGSTAQDADVAIRGTTVDVAMPHALGYREGLTVVVGWTKGVVAAPTTGARAVAVVDSNWPLVIPVPVFFLAFAIWRRRGRDPRRRPITVQYEPPPNLTPAEAGTLLDNSADMRDVTATLVDLAVRGHLRIEEREDSQLFGLIKNQEYVLHQLTPGSPAGQPLAPHEQHLLEGIFSGRGREVKLSQLEDEFYTEVPRIKASVFDRLRHRGFYRARPDHVKAAWMAGGAAFGGLIAFAGAFLADSFLLTPVPFVIAGVLTAFVLMGFGSVMPARTEAGARALEQVLGFEEFLRRVESEHLKRVIIGHPELFDRYLPYAMAFGVEKKWARAFDGIYQQSPTWYVGPNMMHFSPSRFTTSLSSLTTAAGSTMTSSPRSSSGSGFGGGGSSGGGGGGGGGGGF